MTKQTKTAAKYEKGYKNKRPKSILGSIRWRKGLYGRLQKAAEKQGTTVPQLAQDILEKSRVLKNMEG